MLMERQIVQAERGGLARKLRRWGTLGSLALTGLVNGGWHHLDGKAGNLQHIEPALESIQRIDNQLNIVSFNVHGRAYSRSTELVKLFEGNDLDALLLQEVRQNDVEPLSAAFYNKHLVYVLADGKQDAASGGLGNMIITSQRPEEISTRSFSGNSLGDTILRSARGIANDVKKQLSGEGGGLRNFRAGLQEDRAAVAVTIKARVRDELKDIRIITSHISPSHQSSHQRQFPQLMDYVKENTKDNQVTVVCADLNVRPDKVQPEMEPLGYSTKRTGPTSLTTGKVIDYCYHNHDKGNVWTLRAPHSDHYPVAAELLFPRPVYDRRSRAE